MKKFFLISVAALTVGATAPSQAADLPVKAAPVVAAVYNWTGWYVGVNAGGAFSQGSPSTTTVFSALGIFASTSVSGPGSINANGSQKFNSTTFTGGVGAGYNWQAGRLVYGIEADFNYFNPNGSSTVTATYPCCAPTNYTITQGVKTSWLLTARPRIGYAVNNWLFFATGGLAVTNVKASWSFTETFYPSAEPTVSTNKTKTGWVVGGGVEAGLWSNWSAKVEYLYADFGSVSGNGLITTGAAGVVAAAVNNPFSHSLALKTQIVRFGLNYKLSN